MSKRKPSPVRIGVIGAGGICAKMHLPELRDEGRRCKVVLISGRKESRLRRLCDLFDVGSFTHRYEDVIADDSIDAVIVATPHPEHVSWGVKALKAGKHVMMQKPLCADLREAEAFVRAADKSRCVSMCLPHFPDAIHAVRRLVDDGAIGRVSGAYARTSHGGPEVYYREVSQIFREKAQKKLWFFDASQASGGALFDMGIYAVSYLVALLGTVRSVTAVVSTFDKPTTLEDQATLILRMANGAVATAETSWCDPGRTWRFSVHGTEGKFQIPGDGGAGAVKFTPVSYDSDRAPLRVKAVRCGTSIGSAHRHFLDCIEGRRQPPLSHARLARHVTEVLLAALESSRTGRTVPIRSSLRP